MTTTSITPEQMERFKECAPHRIRNATRIVAGAYKRGWTAGIEGKPCDPPYVAHQLPNFLRGSNNPIDGWRAGWLDGERVRRIVAQTIPLGEIRLGERACLTPDHLAASDAYLRRTQQIESERDAALAGAR